MKFSATSDIYLSVNEKSMNCSNLEGTYGPLLHLVSEGRSERTPVSEPTVAAKVKQICLNAGIRMNFWYIIRMDDKIATG